MLTRTCYPWATSPPPYGVEKEQPTHNVFLSVKKDNLYYLSILIKDRIYIPSTSARAEYFTIPSEQVKC